MVVHLPEYVCNEKKTILKKTKTNDTSSATHHKPRPQPHCRVLPPGEFNDMITEPLPEYYESFSCNRFPGILLSHKKSTHINNTEVTSTFVNIGCAKFLNLNINQQQQFSGNVVLALWLQFSAEYKLMK